ncbi:MAG: hypothetical protein ACI9O4_001288 [Chitinophagales bacterium]|jgi:hypothetical protein
MNDHISYAMRNEEAIKSWLSFNSPSELIDWSHLAIELIIYVGLILAFAHAWRSYKRSGSPSALLTLLAAFLYGLVMDILSYYTVENFWHGEFTIMLLFNKLPFYIACFYPALIYHAVMTIRRYDFSRVVEALSTGFFIAFLYMIFDNLGPMLGWWIWDTTDPTTFPYVSSVPLTSYAWMFLFTSAFTYINSKISWDWIASDESKWKIILAHVVQPIITIFMGVLLFIPRNLFARNTPPWDLLPWDTNPEMGAFVYLIMFSLGGWLFLIKWRKPQVERDVLLMIFPFIYLTGLAYIFIAKFHLFFIVTSEGLSQGLAVGNLLVVVLALIVSATILLLSHPVPKD